MLTAVAPLSSEATDLEEPSPVSPKRPRSRPFSLVVDDALRDRSDVHAHDGRSRDRVTSEGAWDCGGLFWPAAPRTVTLEDVRRALADPMTRVAYQPGCGRDVVWLSGDERWQAWHDIVSPHLAIDGDLAAAGWPRHVAYTAELRMRSDGARLLWFEGHC
jgi:hypothetical protein